MNLSKAIQILCSTKIVLELFIDVTMVSEAACGLVTLLLLPAPEPTPAIDFYRDNIIKLIKTKL